MYGVFLDVDEDGIVVDTRVDMVEKLLMMWAEKVAHRRSITEERNNGSQYYHVGQFGHEA